MAQYRFFFDYVYYRIKKKFYRRDSNGFLALSLITLVQVFFLASMVGMVVKYFYDRSTTAPYAKMASMVGAIIYLVLWAYNYRKYDNNYWKYWEYWKDEPKERWKIKGWLVVIVIIIPIIMFYGSAVI